LDDISTTVAPFLERREVDWTSVEAKKQMPTALLRRLRAVDNQINELEARAGDLTEKIALIDNAHASAEALPTDLASLKEAREQVDADLKEAQSALKRAKDAAENSEESLSLIVEKHNDAEKIVVNLEDA
jgi:chromosome segregation ATPase